MTKKSRAASLAGVVATALTLLAFSCTTPPAPTKIPAKVDGACQPNALDACVTAIDDAITRREDPTDAVKAWAAARRESGDPNVEKLLAEMDASSSKAFALSIGGAHVDAKALTAVAIEAPLADVAASSARLVLAIGRATKATFVLARLPDGTMIRAYPSGDALAPFLAGLPPVVVDRDAEDLDAEVDLEAALARAAESGKAFDYVALADAIDVVDAYAGAHPGYRAATLRARVFSGFVGLSETRLADGPPPQRAGAPPEPGALETPYYDLLRVRTDPKYAEWSKRGERILAAVPEAYRPSMVSTFAETPPCGFELPPAISTVDDLAFAHLVTRALLPTMARDPRGRVPIEQWYPAYTSFVKTVSATDTTYLFAARLVLERGASAGIVPSGSEAHRIVANLATKHARALEKLAAARPSRTGIAQLPFLLAPGTMIDPELRDATLALAQAIAKGGLGESKSPGDVLFSLFTSVLTGFDLPGDLRAAHLNALQSVFTAKLKAEFATQVGWGVAALFAIDGAYRLAFDQAPNVGQTAAEITRALEGDATIAQPAAAHLIAAVGRYVTFGLRGELGPAQPKPNTMRPERAASKAALDKAIAELGPLPVGGASDDGFVRDVGELCDAALTTLVSTLSEKLQTTPTAPSAAGCPNDVEPLDARTKNALPPLRDLRNKVMANPAWKAPPSARSKRLKLVVLAISDVIDAIDGNGEHKKQFALGEADAKTILRDALHEWIGEDALENTIVGAYGIARGWAEHGVDYVKASGAFDLRTLLGGLGAFLRGDGESIQGADLLSMLLPSGDAAKSEDLLSALLKVARSLYAQKKLDQGDMLLLGSIVVSAASGSRPSVEAAELADSEGRAVGWVMRLWRSIADLREGAATDPRSFEKDLTASVGAKCGVATVHEIGDLLTSIQDFRDGKRKEARTSLSTLLQGLAQKGFALPRYRFVFKQETRSRALSLSVEIGLAQGLVRSTNAFAIGAGAKTDSAPVLSMDEVVTPADSKDALDESAKYYVHAQAILAAWDFLDGDADAGDLDAASVVTLLHAPSWLSRPGVTDDPSAWTRDSAGALLVLAELAIAKGRPFLAGDLLSLVKASLRPEDDAESLEGLLDPPPFGFAGVKDAEPFITSAKATLKLLAAHLPCMKGKKAASLDTPSCDEWPRAIALRVADAVPALPKLTQKKGASTQCPGTATVDTFLQAADKGVYEPDAFLAAVDVVTNEKKFYDASVMLGRFRRSDHCSQGVFDRLTPILASVSSVPGVRADLESVRVNCSTGAAPADLGQALSALDDSLILVGDPRRSVDTVIFAAAASMKLGSWEPLEAIALKKGFLERWEQRSPETLFAGLVFDHAATILHGDPVRIDATRPQFDLLCGGVPPPERGPICKTLEGLRKSGKPDAALEKAAADAIASLIQPSP